MYNNGQGVTQDYVQAAKWYRKAAEQGLADAQHNLGHMYSNGYGVTQVYAEALKWYRKAAEQRSAAAQYNLGVMYGNGEGVPQDYAEAMRWFRKAAEQGWAEAQYNLGVMYNNGQGVTQDYVQAAKWYRWAAEQGLAEAQSNLDVMYANATISGEGNPDSTEQLSPPPEEPMGSPEPVVEPPPEPTVTASPITVFRVQLAALYSRADAEAEWRRLKRANGDLLGALHAEIMRVDLGDRGVFYRLRAGPLASAAKASALCSRLKAHKLDCFVIKP